MKLRFSLALTAFAFTSIALAPRAEAQATTQPCPAGQPCVVVVPQPQPPPAQVIVQPPPAYGGVEAQVTVQPYGAQPQAHAAAPQAREVRRSRLRWGMIVPGIILTVGGWVGNWITAIPGVIQMELDDAHEGSEGTYFGWQWIPVIGPFVGAGYYADSPHEGYLAMHLVWGVLQTGGILLCILGTVLPEEEVVYQYALGDEPDAPTLSVLPWGGPQGAGLSADLRF